MNKDAIQGKIESFVGNLSNSFALIGSVCMDLNIDFSNIIETSDPENKYITFVRHLITKSVITRPEKSGRSLSLNGQNVLEILVTKKYLNTGVTINLLSTGYITKLTTEELYQRLFAEQLTDIPKLKNLHSSIENTDEDDELQQFENDLFRRYKINDFIELNVVEGAYTQEILKRIQHYLKRQPRG